jgi:hypothetical protein
MTRIERWMGVLMAAGAMAGCDGATEGTPETTAGPPPAPSTPAMPSTPVATVALAQQQKFEIYEGAPGELIFSQTGPYGSAPIALPKRLLRDGDPIAIFQALAPGQPVPGSLTAAGQRFLARRVVLIGGAGAPAPEPDQRLPASDAPRPGAVHQSLGMRDKTANGWTGSSRCPWEFFQLATYEWDQFCPPNTDRSWCEQGDLWSFIWDWNIYRAYAAVCTEFGTAVLKVHVVDPDNPAATFWVDQGTWRYVFTNTFGYPVFKKFDVGATGLGGQPTFHFGGIFEYEF